MTLLKVVVPRLVTMAMEWEPKVTEETDDPGSAMDLPTAASNSAAAMVPPALRSAKVAAVVDWLNSSVEFAMGSAVSSTSPPSSAK